MLLTRHLALAVVVVLALAFFTGCRRAPGPVETPADALMKAARAGDTAKVTQLLDADATLISARDAEKRTPLHHAASGGSVEVVKLLVKRGADPAARDKWNITAMERAALKGHNEIATMLMAAEPTEGGEEEKPLYEKTRKRHREVQELLEEAGGGK